MNENYKDFYFRADVRDDDVLRDSFNLLTRQVFDFDFISWYESGSWGGKYIPHVLTDKKGQVVSNVSANIMRFSVHGKEKNYIQLGTVMTAPQYRRMGLNRFLMNKVMERFGEADGIYLFANDSATEYYPRFGFEAVKEYEYLTPVTEGEGYHLEQVDLTDCEARQRLYDKIALVNEAGNPNDDFWMKNNMGLYRFWLDGKHGKTVCYLPEPEAYVVADVTENELYLQQVICGESLDINRLASSFGGRIKTCRFGYTPAGRDGLAAKIRLEEDCTLFVLGGDLRQVEADKLMFPTLSHA